jgi:hypothetical protein
MMVDGVNCFLVEPVTPENIAAAITRALSANAETRLTIRRNAYQMACEEFHPRRTIHDLGLMYNVCIDSARRNSVPPVAPSIQTQTPIPLMPSEPPLNTIPIKPAEPTSGYRLVPQRSAWNGLDINVEKHQHQWAGVITLRVLTERGNVLRHATAELANSLDYRWLSFRFEPIANSAETSFVIIFERAGDPLPPSALTEGRLFYRA